MIRAASLAALVGLAVVASEPAAFADDVDALVKKGVDLRRQGKEQEALETFQRAAQLKRTPRVVAQVALAEQAIGMWASAERDLKEALDRGASDVWISKNRRQLDEALHVIQSHLGSLQVQGQPADAEVLADGEVVGRLPISTPIRLPIGEISLTVRKDGYDKVTRVVAISKGGLVRETIALHRAPGAPRQPLALEAPPPGRSTGGGQVAGSRPAESQANLTAISSPPGETPPSGHPIYQRWWFWTAIGVVALGAGAGAYVLTRPHCTKTGCDPWPAQ